MNEIMNQLMETSGDIWKSFKKFCNNHDPNSEDFYSELTKLGDVLDEKYLNTPMHLLEAHLFAGLTDALCKSLREKNEN